MDAIQNVPEVHMEIVVALQSRNTKMYTISCSKLNLKQQLVAFQKQVVSDVENDKTFSDVFEKIPKAPKK